MCCFHIFPFGGAVATFIALPPAKKSGQMLDMTPIRYVIYGTHKTI